MALREGEQAPVDDVVMDEFHWYADRDRGVAWQAPLLTLPQTRFLLMSTTLGDVTFFEQELTRRTGRETVTVTSRAACLGGEHRLAMTVLPLTSQPQRQPAYNPGTRPHTSTSCASADPGPSSSPTPKNHRSVRRSPRRTPAPRHTHDPHRPLPHPDPATRPLLPARTRPCRLTPWSTTPVPLA